jgi:hypothetical protein
MYKGFYRKRPLAANLSALALECANFALSAGFVFLRMVKLLFTAAVFIGRIDTPFLAPGVGRVGCLELDYYPYIYRKDILASEAHRHPYIETLGVMYLMKLRYGENFGKTAGSCWRLLFVYALMPWLHRYRVLARPELLANDDVDGPLTLTRLQPAKSMRIFLHDIDGDDVEEKNEKPVPTKSKSKIKQEEARETVQEGFHAIPVLHVQPVALTPAVNDDHKADDGATEIDELKKENERLQQEIDVLKSQLLHAESTAAQVAQEQTRLDL